MDIILVRHRRALTERLAIGSADRSLDEYGEWQAQRVSRWLAHEPVDVGEHGPAIRSINETGHFDANRIAMQRPMNSASTVQP